MTDPRETGLDLNPRYGANGLLTAVVTDAATGQVVYIFDSPASIGTHTTTMRDVRGQPLATYEYSAFGAHVTLQGERRDLNSFMPKEGLLSACVPVLLSTTEDSDTCACVLRGVESR